MAVTNVYWGRIGFAGSCVGALALCIAGLLLGGEIEYLIDQGELHALDGKIRTDEELILRGKQNERDLHDQLASTLAELHKQVQLNKKLEEQEHGKGKGQDAGLENLGAAKSVNLTAVPIPAALRSVAMMSPRKAASAVQTPTQGISPSATQKQAAPAPSCASGCRRCKAGGADDGGQQLHKSVCFGFCSGSNFCGLGDAYSSELHSVDCRGCALLSYVQPPVPGVGMASNWTLVSAA